MNWRFVILEIGEGLVEEIERRLRPIDVKMVGKFSDDPRGCSTWTDACMFGPKPTMP